jgi:hypothetical protein
MKEERKSHFLAINEKNPQEKSYGFDFMAFTVFGYVRLIPCDRRILTLCKPFHVPVTKEYSPHDSKDIKFSIFFKKTLRLQVLTVTLESIMVSLIVQCSFPH